MGFWEELRDNVLHPIRDFVFDPENIGTAAGFALGGPAGAALGKAAGGVVDRIGEEYLDTGTGLREADPITLGSTARDVGTGYLYGKGIEAVAPHVGEFTRGIFGGEGGAMAGVPTGGMPAPAITGGAPAIPATTGGAPTIPGVPGVAGAERVPSMVGAPVASRAAPSALTLAPTPANVTAAAPTDGGGGFLGGLRDFWGDLSPVEKAAVLSQGLGTAANVYGTHQAGQAAERQFEMEEEDRRRRERVGQIIAELLGRELERN